MEQTLKNLPIGIQDFEKLRKEDYLYFLGKKDLFKGLDVEQLEQKWTVHPVLHLYLNTAKYKEQGKLNEVLNNALSQWKEIYRAMPSETEIF
jgi:hypothetical protein